MSREDWAANHRRDDASKLVNPPPSLDGFFPDKPPPPRLVSSPTGKQAAHTAHAPLTHSLGDALRDLPIGSVVKVNPTLPPSPPPSEPPPSPANQNETEPTSRREFKPRVVLEAYERRQAVVDSLSMGLEKAGDKWDVSANVIYSWRRAARLVAEGFAPDKVAQILGVNTPGSTRESAQAVFAAAIPGPETPRVEAPTLPASAPEPAPVATRVDNPISVLEGLKAQLAERDATLAGYKIELDKLRSELVTARTELAVAREHNAALVKTLEAMAARKR